MSVLVNINKIFTSRFCSAGHCITKVGLSNLCTHDQDGTEFDDPIFPFKITFEPTGEINFPEAKPETRQKFLSFIKLQNLKALTKYERPKMKRDACQKCSLFGRL